MFKSRLDGTLEWVRDNCPPAAMLGPDRTREIVKQVLDQTGAVRILLNIGGSIVGFLAGTMLAEPWSAAGESGYLYIGTATIGAVLAGLLANAAGEYYLHRKLESVFEKA